MSGRTSGPRSPCPPWVAPPSVDPPGRTGLHPPQRRYVMYKASSCANSYSIFFWGGVHVTMCSVLGCMFYAFVILTTLLNLATNELEKKWGDRYGWLAITSSPARGSAMLDTAATRVCRCPHERVHRAVATAVRARVQGRSQPPPRRPHPHSTAGMPWMSVPPVWMSCPRCSR